MSPSRIHCAARLVRKCDEALLDRVGGAIFPGETLRVWVRTRFRYRLHGEQIQRCIALSPIQGIPSALVRPLLFGFESTQRPRPVATTMQHFDGVVFGVRGGPCNLIDPGCFPASVFRHPLTARALPAETSGSATIAGLSPCSSGPSFVALTILGLKAS